MMLWSAAFLDEGLGRVGILSVRKVDSETFDKPSA